MNRTYRIRYHTTPPHMYVAPAYRPTRIIVSMMSGIDHILFTESDDETYYDIKTVILPYLEPGTQIDEIVLVLKNDDGTYNFDNLELNDDTIIPYNNADLKLDLLLRPSPMSLAIAAANASTARAFDFS